MTDRRAGSVGVTVDLTRTGITLNRQLGQVGVTVDLKIIPSLTVSATQAQAVSIALVVETAGGELTLATTQGQTVILARAVSLRRGLTQATQPSLLQRLSLRLTRAATQAQAVTGILGKGYQRLVTAVQATAVTRQRLVRITRATTGNRRVATVVTIAPAVARGRTISARTTPRLLRQIRLTRAITQGQSAALVGVPVTLQVLATIQTRSLDLGRVITLIRGIVQATAVYVPRSALLERTLPVPTVLSRQQDASLTRTLAQGQAVSLELRDLTPLTELILTTTVGQSLSISSAPGAGGSAREFAVGTRRADFVVGGRTGQFSAARRGVRFTVETR